MKFFDKYDNIIFCPIHQCSQTHCQTEEKQITLKYTIPKNFFNQDIYYTQFNLGRPGIELIMKQSDKSSFNVNLIKNKSISYGNNALGIIAPKFKWNENVE